MEADGKTIRWKLKDLLNGPVDAEVNRSLEELENHVSELEVLRGDLTPEVAPEIFLKALRLLETVNTVIRRLQGYSYLWLSEDTQNEAALNLRDRLDQALVPFGNRLLFFDLWFKDLPESAAERLISVSGDLRYFLQSIRRFQPYTLSEKEEQLLALKDPNGIDALVGLYEMITNQFSFSLKVNGKDKKLTRDELVSQYYNPSGEVRAAAFRELYRVFGENSTVLAQIYSHRVRDWYTEGITLRGYASPISARNLGSDLPDNVVETLLAVCRRNAGLFQKYFKFKARALGMEKLHRYDIYAPLTASEKKYDFSAACQLVLETFSQFSPKVHDLAQRVFEDRHLDPQPRHGKRGGGFCYAALPALTPWVLVNYNGRPGDVATLAHELGHAVHAMLAGEHSVLTFHAPQPLAETASIFAEILLTDRFLREENDPSVRRDLLVRVIDEAYATVLRQAYLTLFEIDAHEQLVEGASFDELAGHYLENLTEQFGDAVEVSDEFKWEWLTVPHIYETPFYTYSYSFGQLLVLALYQQYRREGSAFVPKYLKILEYGGSKEPVAILQEADLDVASPDFWQGGFDFIGQLIDELMTIA